MTLEECLRQLPWRTIAATAQAQALPYTHRHDKPTLCTRLAAAIMKPERLQATWRALSPEAQAALRALAEADGLMRREVFTTRFGSIRPYRPWRDEAPTAPWKHPASPAEELAYRGLVFVLNQGSKRRPLWVVVLPVEIQTALRPFLEAPMTALPSPTPAACGSSPSLSRPTGEGGGRGEGEADISTATLTFLCFLHREDLKPLQGRWLPPNACRTLASHLSAISHRPSAIIRSERLLSTTDCVNLTDRNLRDPSQIRSERQWPYLSFLHYLAERAGLVDLEGAWLKPTLAAQSWLAQPRAGRLRVLWEAWREDSEANAELWLHFHLPGDADRGLVLLYNKILYLHLDAKGEERGHTQSRPQPDHTDSRRHRRPQRTTAQVGEAQKDRRLSGPPRALPGSGQALLQPPAHGPSHLR